MWTVKLNLYQIQQRKHSYHNTIGISVPLVSVVNTTRYETQQWTHTAATHSSEIYLKTQTTVHETTSLLFFSSFVSKRRQQMFSSKQKTLLSLLWSSFTQDTTPLFRHSTNAQSRNRDSRFEKGAVTHSRVLAVVIQKYTCHTEKEIHLSLPADNHCHDVMMLRVMMMMMVDGDDGS